MTEEWWKPGATVEVMPGVFATQVSDDPLGCVKWRPYWIDEVKKVKKLRIFRSVQVLPCMKYIRMGRDVELSDQAPLQVGLAIRVKGENIALDTLLWDDDEQHYTTHFPTLKLCKGINLDNFLEWADKEGWVVVFRDPETL